MGYYTRYTLEIEDYGNEVNSCSHKSAIGNKYCPECGVQVCSMPHADKVISDLEKYTLEKYTGEDGYDGNFILGLINDSSDSTKWYDHEKHMKDISKKYPKCLFILSGEGEESGDIWKKYFMNGKMQIAKAQIVIEEFDKNKLV